MHTSKSIFYLHFRATSVKISGAPLSVRCASKKVLADLSSESFDPWLECSSVCLPNATARMLCIVKTPKWLQKDYLINEHGHGDTCQSYNFSVDLCLSILSDHTEDFHFLLFPTNFHKHLLEILIFTVITFWHRIKKQQTCTQSALFSLFLLKFVFVNIYSTAVQFAYLALFLAYIAYIF